MTKEIISGGQTGVDRAGLDIAIALGIPHGGWCPKDGKAEDGTIPAVYQLQETPKTYYKQRTEWNVRDSDGTLVLTRGSLLDAQQQPSNWLLPRASPVWCWIS